MGFWVYMLRCSDDALYVGQTDDLEKRVAQHADGYGCSFTSKRLPVELIWADEFTDRISALERERQIKGWSRAKKLALARGDWRRVQELSSSMPFDAVDRPSWLARK